MAKDEYYQDNSDRPSDDSSLIGEQIRHQQISARVPEHIARGVFSTGAIVTQGPHEFVIDFLLSMSRPHQISARVIMVPIVIGQMINALAENVRRYEERFGPLTEKKPGPNARDAQASSSESNPAGKAQASFNAPTQSAAPDAANPPAEGGAEGSAGSSANAGGGAGPGVQPVGESAAASEEQDQNQAARPSPSKEPEQERERRPSVQEVYDELKIPDDVISGAYANAVMIGHSAGEFFFDFITNFYPRSAVSCRVYLSARQVPRFLDALRYSMQRYQQRLQTLRQQQIKPQRDQPPQPPQGPTELA